MISRPSLLLIIAPLAIASCNRSNLGRPDTGVDNPDGGTDSGMRDGGDVVVGCDNPEIDPAPNGETCSYTAGGGATLIRGDIVVPDGVLQNGHLLIVGGKVACAACDCSADPSFAGASVVACANGLVSPGLINAHEHLTFGEGSPVDHGTERFEHRHDWREGQNGHTNLATPPSSSGTDPVLYAELRHLFGGATTVNGSGGADGLLRNVDRNGQNEGLTGGIVRYQTFPLGDSSGTRITSGCGYQSIDMPDDTDIANAIAYTPHIAEGIDLSARNEFACLSGEGSGSSDIIIDKTAIIHGVGLLARDYATMAADGSSLIWSARTNIDLYGHTAPVTLAANAGVEIALGTDWPASGSMNVLRELACFYEFNERNLGGFFTDRQLFDMATKNGAEVLQLGDQIGLLAPGHFADVAIFDQSTNAGYLAALKGEPKDVALVMRSGAPLYGDDQLLAGLTAQDAGCETLDVCGKSKRACVQKETGRTIAQLQSAVRSSTIELFACGTPAGEPSCIPFRVGEFDGMPTSGDQDGDGVPDAMDDCPSIFNPARDDLDMGQQADADADGDGDVCDVCPLDANSTSCSAPDPNDRDNDGVPNTTDNCPSVANADQADRDSDLIGDACDACPDQSNTGGALCTSTIYAVKQGGIIGRIQLDDVLVTAVGPTGFFVQTVPGDASYDDTLRERFSGLFAFTSATGMKPAAGDRIDLEGDVGDFFGQTQISRTNFTVSSSGNPLPAPIMVTAEEVATGAPRAKELEAVFIQIGQATVSELEPAPGAGDMAPTYEFVVNQILRVNDYLYRAEPFPMVDDVIPNLQGILRFANNNSKIEPRGAEDLGIPPRLFGFEPADVYARTGLTNAVPSGGLAVLLSRATDAAVTVNLSAVGIAVPPSVDISAGSDRADVPITTTAAGTATITASYDGVTVTGHVRVYDDAAPRRVAALLLDRTSVAISSSVDGTVQIDIPGAVGGTQVSLQVAPAALATVPASVTVAEGEVSVRFTLNAGANTGSGMLTATAPGGSRQLPFSVVTSVDRPPMMAGDLVITEVLRNPSATDEWLHEWFEVYNPTSDAIAIDGLVVEDNNGMQMLTAPGAVLQPGSYAVIAYSSDLLMNGGVDAIASYGAADLRLSNSDDVVRLTYQGTEIDVVDWGSGWPGAGQGVAMCLHFPYAADNNASSAWTNSAGSFGNGGDTGSPGVASDATNCP